MVPSAVGKANKGSLFSLSKIVPSWRKDENYSHSDKKQINNKSPLNNFKNPKRKKSDADILPKIENSNKSQININTNKRKNSFTLNTQNENKLILNKIHVESSDRLL